MEKFAQFFQFFLCFKQQLPSKIIIRMS